jgi:pyruvate formate-lyase/glycerol dehydratase family glycyl radical enzyme
MEAQLSSPKRIAHARVGRIRERIILAPQEICIERARYITMSMAENWDLHPLTRMSLALEYILKNISVTIREDELIVGCRTSKLKGAPLFPENKIQWIATDVDRFEKRDIQRALITPEEKQELKETVIPFWKGKTVEDRFQELLPRDVLEEMDKLIYTFMLEITYGIGHFTMDHGRVLSKGLSGIMEEAAQKFQDLSKDDQKREKGLFYDAVIRSLNAAILFANRYADLAHSLSQREKDSDRAKELAELSRICRKVPEYPADTFHEAVQSLYFIHLIAQIESGGNSVSLGRIDQILYPYYQKDIQKGAIDPETARELLSLLFLKTNETWNVLEEAYIPGGEGTEGKTTQNVTVGGVDGTGKDSVNALSYIALNAYADIRTVQPNFGVRIGPCSEDLFFRTAVKYAGDGVLLHFFNDESIIRSLVKGGHSIEDARDYGVVGCLEPNAQGKTFGSTFAAQFNGIKCVELGLNNGQDVVFGFPAGVATGDPEYFTDFNAVWKAYDAQASYFIGQLVKGITCLDRAIAETLPSPFASAMIDGPMEKAMDLTQGGAVYNSTGVQLIGFSNIADSLFAIKKAVFQDRYCTLTKLAQWLSGNWIDAEDKRNYFCNHVSKYGNDEDEVDKMAAAVIRHFCERLSGYRNFRGGHFWPGVFSVGFHITMGALTGATADGRYAGAVLGNGITPSEGMAQKGPTAIMNSVTKLPLDQVFNGLNLNMRFNGKAIPNQGLAALIRGYFQAGGMQVQFNMADDKTLREAQKNPDQYRDLIVRISGYSAIFVNLSPTAQDEIIHRVQLDL